MTTVGWHASHEQMAPSQLLVAVCHPQQASTRRCRLTTSRRGARVRASPASLGRGWAPATSSTTLPFGIVTAPGQRYDPAIIAQAAATLTEVFPHRLWIALGIGAFSNEHVTE